ncbi:apolipoprotein N-acyltransferase [Xanthobacter autotrophicus]|uniref:apolipoprotein N-acyltransferase n=1 Tax=Xanthobacter autotrophicus TaxID=280 RepID=UPI001E4C5487|nr:apolipoprotein N-acyltransferase [Xanthobacter autotrophicus]UDQ90709.1 apolipoprotein N-acyltransferase [Xanthobacter autotrophicus]
MLRFLTGWRRRFVAWTAGAVGALAMPPFDLWPVLALSFPVLVLLLDGCRGDLKTRLLGAAGVGWWFGFGYFLASLWWIGAAFLVEADVFGWLLPVAVVAMPAGLALFTAFGTAVARLLWSKGGLRLFALTFGLTLAEWLRGHVLTGFPWNTYGYAVSDDLLLMQAASVIGVWGLTFFCVLLLSTPVLLLTPGRRGFAAVGAAALVIAGTALWGGYRLSVTPLETVPGVALRVMQPNLSQDKKFAYDRREQILKDYLALSAKKSETYPGGLADVTVLIWPESSFPFIYEREPWAAEAIAAVLPPNVTLVTGAVRYDFPPPGQRSPFFNSIRVMDHRGRVLENTDKVHLVPFGEYLPFQAELEALGIEQLTRVRGGFSSGAAFRALQIPGLPLASPLVCYEIIFPGKVVPQGPRPAWLLNLTNDAWFGLTPGPYQHFAQARMRAVEEGLPLVRAANTGISAIVDPLGRIVASHDLGLEGLVDGPLPKPLQTVSVAAKLGGTFIFALLATALALASVPLCGCITRKG